MGGFKEVFEEINEKIEDALDVIMPGVGDWSTPAPAENEPEPESEGDAHE